MLFYSSSLNQLANPPQNISTISEIIPTSAWLSKTYNITVHALSIRQDETAQKWHDTDGTEA